jgi:hypothetical protein
VKAVVKVLPDLANVGLFLIFTFMLTAMVGVSLYSGMLYNRCSIPVDYDLYPIRYITDNSSQRACSKTGNGFYLCPENTICGDLTDYNRKPEDVLYDSGSYMQVANFDNVGTAMLNIFHIFTSDGWNAQMFNLIDIDTPLVAALFCIYLRVFFLLILFNLLLAIIISAFISLTKQEAEKENQNDLIDENRK